jgi:hypothetical protein
LPSRPARLPADHAPAVSGHTPTPTPWKIHFSKLHIEKGVGVEIVKRMGEKPGRFYGEQTMGRTGGGEASGCGLRGVNAA